MQGEESKGAACLPHSELCLLSHWRLVIQIGKPASGASGPQQKATNAYWVYRIVFPSYSLSVCILNGETSFCTFLPFDPLQILYKLEYNKARPRGYTTIHDTPMLLHVRKVKDEVSDVSSLCQPLCLGLSTRWRKPQVVTSVWGKTTWQPNSLKS